MKIVFIYKPDFNEPNDKYVDIIFNYNKLIFSNYDELEIYIGTIINTKIVLYELYKIKI